MRPFAGGSAALPLLLAVLDVAACKTRDPPFAHRPVATSCPANAEAGAALDACTQDSDCPASSVCACFPAGANARTTGNLCSLPGNCRVDADCPSAEVCSPSYTLTCAQPFKVVYACHTSSDDCANDSDCSGSGMLPGISELCTWQPDRGRWGCVAFGCEG